MPPKVAKRPSVKLLKFGEILFDENRSVILLCSHCFIDFINLQDFQDHLKNCVRVRHIFKAPNLSKLNCEEGTQLLTTVKKNTKEMLIYGFTEGQPSGKPANNNDDITDLLRIEQELLDPRWYTDSATNNDAKNEAQKKTATYNELIEEVTPFVQFKENVKSAASSRPIRVAVRETAKNQSKTERDIPQNKLKNLPAAITEKAEPRGKRQTVQQPSAQQKTIPLENTKKQQAVKPIKSTITEVVGNKPTPKAVTKVVTVLESIKSGRELRTTSLTAQNQALKRKAESEVLHKSPQNADNDNALKRRKTLGQQLQTTTQSKSISETTPKSKNQIQNTKPIQISKFARTSTTVIIPSESTIVLNKKENKNDPNAKKLVLNNSRSESLNNNKKQSQPQIQAQAKSENNQHQHQHQHQSKSIISPTKNSIESLSANKINKIQIQEMTKSTPINIQTAPVMTSTPILKKNPNSPIKTTVHSPANNNQETAEILNKLQTLGLKVKRTNPNPPKMNNSNEQALEIIKKLQSKGMNVKIVQKSNTPPTLHPFTTIHNTLSPIKVSSGNTLNTISLISPEKNIATVANSVLASKPNFRKNVLIKKCTY